MDNAAKALIMAGAILISLALVGLGVYIFSISSDLQDTTGQRMDAVAIQSLNSELQTYAGKRVKGSTINAFLEKARVYTSQQVLPIDLRSGAVSNYTFDTGATTAADEITPTGKSYKIVDSSKITTSAYYELAISDELPAGSPDGYLDTYQIKKYN